jgi:hypothetical protein
MRNILFVQKKIKLPNIWYFVENTIEIMLQVFKMQQISLLPEHIKQISRGIFFLCMFKYANQGRLKVKFKHSL